MISIIVPAHNAENTIERCLRSLQGQTYTDTELIVIDDGSSDRTVDIVRELAASDARIKLVQQSQSGVGAARNHGIDVAAGECICFVDSDDWVSSKFVEVLNSMYELGIMPVVNVFRSDNTESVIKQLPNNYMLSEKWIDDFLCGSLKEGILFSVWNKLFSTAVLKKEEIRFSDQLKIGEDLLFVFQYLCKCREIRFCDEAAYHYEIIEGSAVTTKRDYSADYDKLLFLLRENLNGLIYNPVSLSKWAFDAVIQVVSNPIICSKRYKVFRDWWDYFVCLDLFQTAIKLPIVVSKKRLVFYRLAISGNTFGIYLLLRGFRRLNEFRRKTSEDN